MNTLYVASSLNQNSNEYKQKINSLISKLDLDSKETVFRILNRIHLLSEGKTIKFTSKEKEMVKDYLENFNPSIYRITEDWYYYNGYHLPINSFETSVFWYKLGLNQLLYPQNILNKDVIDAGAFVGDSALVISEFTNGNIYGFETLQNNFDLMKKTIQMNDITNLIPINMGLSDKVEVKDLFIANNSLCNSFCINGINTFSDSEKISVKCTTIDEFVKENNLEIGLIKSDIEGGEQMLLKGAINTLRDQKPTLIISIYHSFDDFFEIKKWIEDLDLGYQFQIFKPVMQNNFITETVLIAETKI